MLARGSVVVCHNGAGHQVSAGTAMVAGLRRHGIEARVQHFVKPLPPEPVVVCWGWRNGREVRAHGREVLVMERGYLGDRFHWTSLGWNGLNGRALFNERDDPQRWEKHFAPLLRPWRTSGRYVLLMGQVLGDASLNGVDFGAWAKQTMRTLESISEIPVYYRPHPITRGRVNGIKPTLEGDLDSALAKAAAVVTWNSNSGVDAVLAGVPTVAMDHGSMAYPVAGHDLSALPPTPDRETWGARLSWCQWTPAEIANGAAWELVGQGLEERLACRTS